MILELNRLLLEDLRLPLQKNGQACMFEDRDLCARVSVEHSSIPSVLGEP